MTEDTTPPAMPFPAAEPLTDGQRRVRDERERQKTDEGYSAEDDDVYIHGELARAAFAYILADSSLWPWGIHSYRPTTTVRNLEKAGALFWAEAERLERHEKTLSAEDHFPGGEATRVITAYMEAYARAAWCSATIDLLLSDIFAPKIRI